MPTERVTTVGDRGSSGVVYYAVGRSFLDEAMVSARSVRAAMPQVPLAIFTNEPVPDGVFDMCFDTDAAMGTKAQKIASLIRSPFSKTLYLDADTYMIAPVPELFDILDRFDMALALSSLGRLPKGWGVVPESFPVLNCGVVAFRRCEPVSRLFHDWLERHGNTSERDQPAFRDALYDSNVRWVTLANRYNFCIDFPQAVRHGVKILHGRHPDPASVGKRVRPIGEVSAVLPVSYLFKTRVLGRKTQGPRASELLRQGLKYLGRRFGRAG